MFNIFSYSIERNIMAFSTTRNGGESFGNYFSFNINEFVGDNPLCVKRNIDLLSKKIGVNADKIVLPHQTHGDRVALITSQFLSLDSEERKLYLDGVDALITNLCDVCIGVSTADCVPIIFYDNVNKVIGVAHAGWKGTVNKIVLKTIRKMQEVFNTDVSQLKVIIGPAISFESFEVGEDVYTQFKKFSFFSNKNAICSSFEFKAINTNNIVVDHSFESDVLKWHINLPLCNELILREAGVLPSNIERHNICTYTNCGLFFSARRLGINSGRIYTGIVKRCD